MKFCYNTNFPFLINPKDLDPSYKTDLDLWYCFGRKTLSLITEEIRYTRWTSEAGQSDSTWPNELKWAL